MKNLFCFFALFLFLETDINAQSVGVNFNGATPNAAAALDIDVSALGAKKGLLIPRILLADRTAITLAAPAQGLLVYQTDGVQGFYYNTSITTTPNWIFVINSGGGIRWDQITAPTGNLTLAHGANSTSFTFDGATFNPFSISSNSLASGSLLGLSSTSTAGTASGISSILNISSTGANTNANHLNSGVIANVGNTGTGNTNYAGSFSAQGATSNYGLYANAINATVNNYGISANATGTGTNNYGGYFYATGATSNYAVAAYTDADNGYAVYGSNYSTGTGTQIGMSGNKAGNTGTANGYGVFGNATGTGNINFGGNFYATGATSNYGARVFQGALKITF